MKHRSRNAEESNRVFVSYAPYETRIRPQCVNPERRVICTLVAVPQPVKNRARYRTRAEKRPLHSRFLLIQEQVFWRGVLRSLIEPRPQDAFDRLNL